LPGTTTDIDAPPGRIPILVRAGSIVPIGPIEQYTGEKPPKDLEIRIYPGADGDFSLYEDEGTNYNYEKGQRSTIHFHWNDRRRIQNFARNDHPSVLALYFEFGRYLLISSSRPGANLQHSANDSMSLMGYALGCLDVLDARMSEAAPALKQAGIAAYPGQARPEAAGIRLIRKVKSALGVFRPPN
jgi:Domain of unknown function (DUF5110)